MCIRDSCVTAFAAQGTSKKIRTIAEFLGGALDALLGGVWNIARERSVVEDDGNSGGGKTAFLGHIADGDYGAL